MNIGVLFGWLLLLFCTIGPSIQRGFEIKRITTILDVGCCRPANSEIWCLSTTEVCSQYMEHLMSLTRPDLFDCRYAGFRGDLLPEGMGGVWCRVTP